MGKKVLRADFEVGRVEAQEAVVVDAAAVVQLEPKCRCERRCKACPHGERELTKVEASEVEQRSRRIPTKGYCLNWGLPDGILEK